MDLFGIELMAHAQLSISIFTFSHLLYALVTMEMTRLVFLRYYGAKKSLYLILGLICLVGMFVGIRYLVEETIYPLLIGHGNYYEGTTFEHYVRDNFLYAVKYITLGFLVFLFENNWNNQQKIWELNLQKKEAELKYLRSQINPHFLFNTLNNVFTLVYEKSDDAPAAYLKMTDLTRYMLYEKENLVSLTDEIKHLKNYLSLQEIRFKDPVLFDLNIEVSRGEALIPPYLLITLAENIFKHGAVTDPKHPATLTVEETSTKLFIKATNKIKIAEKDKTGGVGLENIMNRLKLLYPENHTFKENSDGECFEIEICLYFKNQK